MSDNQIINVLNYNMIKNIIFIAVTDYESSNDGLGY